MAKHGENIYQRKDGRWEGKYIRERVNGKIKYGYLAGKSYAEVLQRKQEKMRELERKGMIAPSDPLLMSGLSDRWLESQKGTLKETTIVKYSSILKNHILPEYGKRYVNDLTDDEVRLWIEGLTLPGHGRERISPKSANAVASVLRLIFRYARTYCNATAPELADVQMKQDKNQIEILSHSEQDVLKEYLMDNLNLSNLGILSTLYTGVRLGEICALRWGSINANDELLDVHATMSRISTDDPLRRTRIVITPPKSACSTCMIPIPADLLRLMQSMRRMDDSFFLTGDVVEYMDPRTMENRFKAALSACGIREVKFHALRHTFATNCVELGFDVKSLSEILGHANITVTMNRYVHPTILMKKDYMDRLSLT